MKIMKNMLFCKITVGRKTIRWGRTYVITRKLLSYSQHKILQGAFIKGLGLNPLSRVTKYVTEKGCAGLCSNFYVELGLQLA